MMGWNFSKGFATAADMALTDYGRAETYNGITHTPLKHEVVGSALYMAMRIEGGGPTRVIGLVFLLEKQGGEVGYKLMDESMGPVESHCPVAILDLLTPIDSEWANTWRARCRHNAAVAA